MKKYLSILLIFAMLLCLFSCSSGDENIGSEDISTGITDEATQEATKEATDEPIAPPTEDVTDETTSKKTDTPTEEPTEEPTETPTAESTEEPTEEPTEANPEILFEQDFSIEGSYSELLIEAMDSALLALPNNKTNNTIYIGESTSDLMAAAKALVTRAESYSDFAIVSDAKDLAIYATTDYAIEKAIDYLLDNYVKGGCISVPKNLSYTEAPAVKDIKIDGKTLDNFTVVAKTDLQDIASGLAKDLTLLTGLTVAFGEGADGAMIELTAQGSEKTIGSSYSVQYSGQRLSITAENKVTLAYAVSGLVKKMSEGLNISDGFSETYTLETKTSVATDIELFKYCGTWQATDEANPTTMVSYWDAAYVEVDFTGNAITLLFSSPTTFLYRIDGGAYTTVSKFNGEYTVFANDGGTHTVRVLYNQKENSMYFAGVKVGADVTLSRTPDKKYYIQFVGDSISDDGRSFSHNSADVLDWDYSVIACEALSLVKDKGYWRYNNGFTNENGYADGTMSWHFKQNFGVTSVGMEDAFFKLGIPNKMKSDDPRFADIAANYYTEKYDFTNQTGNTPDIVFIFLGTNDLSSGSSKADVALFANTYKSFVEKIFEFYGKDTKICMMQAISASSSANPYDTTSMRYVGMDRAAEILMKEYPDNVHYIDAQRVFSWGIELSSDGTHPSAVGYQTLTEKIANYLKHVYK